MFKPRIAGREVQSADIMLTENGEGEAGIMSRTKGDAVVASDAK